MFSSSLETRLIFINKLNQLDSVYDQVFSRLENRTSISSGNIDALERLKEVNKVIYHLTWAFVYECMGTSRSEEAIKSYASAIREYSNNKQEFDDIKILYKTIKNELLESHKNQLYKIASSIKGLSKSNVPSLDKIIEIIQTIQNIIGYLEDPYQKKCDEFLSSVNSISPDKLTDITNFVRAYHILLEIYSLFEKDGYCQEEEMFRKFSNMQVDENNPPTLAKQPEKQCHWLIHNLMMTNNVVEFIQLKSSQLPLENNNATNKRGRDVTDLAKWSDGKGFLKRTLFRANRSTSLVAMEKEEEATPLETATPLKNFEYEEETAKKTKYARRK